MSREAMNKIIKSCIVSRKGGVPMCEIENDYRDLVGQGIPYMSLGYRTLQDFIRSIDFVEVKTNYFGDSILSVSDPKVAHIDSLVKKQKDSLNRYAGSKQKRRNRYGKSRCQNYNKLGENYNPINKEPEGNFYRPEKFARNTRMEYNQSKWYSDRPKDSWKQKRIETRELQRFNNFNSARTSLQTSSNNSSVQNHDNSWSARTASSGSVEETRYNFNSLEEKKYAQESRGSRFQVQVADTNNNNANSTVGRSHHQDYNSCRPGQFGGKKLLIVKNSIKQRLKVLNVVLLTILTIVVGISGTEMLTKIGYHTVHHYVTLKVDNGGLDYKEISFEPLINGNQLIGDDFFLQLASRNLKSEIRKPNVGAARRCGLCVSGQTIDECRQRLENTQYLSSSITILLGAVDIFRGHSLEKMITDLKRLLDVCKNRFNISKITLCTIPPLANYSVRFNLRKLAVLYAFNNWIKLHSNYRPDDSYIHHYNIIDLFSRFTDCNHRTLYDYFQLDARMVSGCPYPHILWNKKGRRTTISMLDI